MYPNVSKEVSPLACYMIQENNLFALESRLFRCCFFIIKPSYLYPNLTTQLCDVCLSVRRDKATKKLKWPGNTLTWYIINYDSLFSTPLSQLKTHLLIDFDEIYFATGFARLFF